MQVTKNYQWGHLLVFKVWKVNYNLQFTATTTTEDTELFQEVYCPLVAVV